MSTQSVDSNVLHGVAHACLAAGLPVEVIDTAARLGVSQQLPRVLQFTRELFGCSPTVRVEHDPEIPDYTCLVVDVTTMGSVEEAVRKNDEWHQHLVSNVRESLEVFCLSIDIQS